MKPAQKTRKWSQRTAGMRPSRLSRRQSRSWAGAERARLQKSQQDWVRVTRNGCNADDSCLEDVYMRRIDVVRRIDNRGHMNPNE
jgi:uncharacterized protein